MSDSATSVSALLLPRLQADQATARRAQNKDLVLLLGMLISEVKNREIELRRDINDDDAVDVVRKAIKRRKEAVAVYEKAARSDLAAKEQAEANALDQYLPPQVDPAELRAAVVAAVASGAANVGAVMAKVMPLFKGRADGSSINALAREVLAGSK
ncbi:MAG: GatB/YqeY domain-containing protein [Gemmatimonadota bacterium]|nr:GatB/YqeY domain-containing protein [Gemmatimonadota bacterium]